MLWPAFHFHSVLLIFINLWPISTLCVADMVHVVADMVCGRYRRFPRSLLSHKISSMQQASFDNSVAVLPHLQVSLLSKSSKHAFALQARAQDYTNSNMFITARRVR